ncbi:MAG: hypothetical protein ACK50O_00090 [Pirellulaceae bacterium]
MGRIAPQRTSELLTGQMDKESQSQVARKQGMPTLPVPPKVTAGVKKVGGTDWKGGWHRLERWVAPIGKVTLVRGVPESPLVGWFSASAGVGDLRRLLVV